MQPLAGQINEILTLLGRYLSKYKFFVKILNLLGNLDEILDLRVHLRDGRVHVRQGRVHVRQGR